jgi:hypothetical protein
MAARHLGSYWGARRKGRKPKKRRSMTDASSERPRSTQRARTLSAWGPFGPCVVSNSTRWPSSRER